MLIGSARHQIGEDKGECKQMPFMQIIIYKRTVPVYDKVQYQRMKQIDAEANDSH